ncbi:MAG: GreA/GreB family elongation factor [Bacteroidales bacterium]|nr:GreA/GreB family elongation factor [Bacteroidales bacterium]
MSRGFVKDGDIEEVPAVEQRAALPDGLPNYVTAEGLAALQREREEMVARRDAADGNESDRRVLRNYLSAKLKLLDERIASAVPGPQPEDVEAIGFGAYITLSIDSAEPCTLRIVGADEADAPRGLISFFSPVAKAVAGHRAGDFIPPDPDKGRRSIRILAVSYTPIQLSSMETPMSSASGKPASGRYAPSALSLPLRSARGPLPLTSRGWLRLPEATSTPAASIGENNQGGSDNAVCEEDNSAQRLEDAEEVLPIVNERGLTVGKATRRECHKGGRLLHPVVHLHVFNSRGELYLQQRPLWKDIQPGKWDTACGGHIRFVEPASLALMREAEEELGLKDFEPKAVRKYIFESPTEREYVYVYRTVWDGEIIPGEELASGRFWTRAEIETKLDGDTFTPNFVQEYRKLLAE